MCMGWAASTSFRMAGWQPKLSRETTCSGISPASAMDFTSLLPSTISWGKSTSDAKIHTLMSSIVLTPGLFEIKGLAGAARPVCTSEVGRPSHRGGSWVSCSNQPAPGSPHARRASLHSDSPTSSVSETCTTQLGRPHSAATAPPSKQTCR